MILFFKNAYTRFHSMTTTTTILNTLPNQQRQQQFNSSACWIMIIPNWLSTYNRYTFTLQCRFYSKVQYGLDIKLNVACATSVKHTEETLCFFFHYAIRSNTVHNRLASYDLFFLCFFFFQLKNWIIFLRKIVILSVIWHVHRARLSKSILECILMIWCHIGQSQRDIEHIERKKGATF